MIALGFVLAAGAGAMVRHLVNRLGAGWVGTAAVNTVGAFVLGWLVASDPSRDALTVFGVGFLGSLTTFSTFSLEVVDEPMGRRWMIIGTMLALGLVAAAVGARIP